MFLLRSPPSDVLAVIMFIFVSLFLCYCVFFSWSKSSNGLVEGLASGGEGAGGVLQDPAPLGCHPGIDAGGFWLSTSGTPAHNSNHSMVTVLLDDKGTAGVSLARVLSTGLWSHGTDHVLRDPPPVLLLAILVRGDREVNLVQHRGRRTSPMKGSPTGDRGHLVLVRLLHGGRQAGGCHLGGEGHRGGQAQDGEVVVVVGLPVFRVHDDLSNVSLVVHTISNVVFSKKNFDRVGIVDFAVVDTMSSGEDVARGNKGSATVGRPTP